MKKILVTGCSGYIGKHLVNLLSSKGYDIYGIDLRETRQLMTAFLLGDIRSDFRLEDEFDAVVHLAALVSVPESEKDPINYYSTNFHGTLNVLDRVKTKNFIFASTGAAEHCENPYGISKRAAEDVIKQFCTTSNTPYTIFRFYNVIGTQGYLPTNPDGIFYNLVKAAKHTKVFSIFGNDYNTKDGTCVRDYVHVSEICNAILLAIDKPANSTENLGHGVGHTVKELTEIFQKVNNVSFRVEYKERRKGDVESSVLANVSSYMQTQYTIEQLLKLENHETILH